MSQDLGVQDTPVASSTGKKADLIGTTVFDRPGRIMVVEDDPGFLKLLTHILEERNHMVIPLNRGDLVLQAALSEKPDLILLDLHLPGKGGMEICSQLKSNEAYQGVPVLMMTGVSESEIHLEALESGANDFLEKSVGPIIIAARVRSLLKYRRAVEALEEAKNGLTNRVEHQAHELREINLKLNHRVEDLEVTQKELTQIHGKMDQLVGSIPSILIGLDAHNVVVHWNEVAAKVLGLTESQTIGKPISACPINWEMAAVLDQIKACRNTGQRIRLQDVTFTMADNRVGMLGLNLTPIQGDESDTFGVLIFGADITVRKSMEQRYLQGQKMEAIGRLAGGIAHDFNNMLMVILGQCELMRMLPLTREQQEDKLDEIHSCGEKAAALTSQLLAFSRKQIFQPTVVSMNDVVEDTVKMLRRLIGEDIELELSLDSRIKRIHADPGQITQILMNLAVNARDAMPEGGALEIKTEIGDGVGSGHPVAADPKWAGKEFLVLTVKDAGLGMDENTRSHIFEPFYTTKKKGKGTGLGLATVYGIVEQHDGRIEVSSCVGKGTTFSIYWPCVEESQPRELNTVEQKRMDGGNERILVVEDEAQVRTVIEEMLGSAGYCAYSADRYATAVDAFNQKLDGKVDLLITDMVMPEMNGVELSERFIDMAPGIKVLYVTGHSERSVLNDEKLQAGNALLQKPFTRDQLLQKVRNVLNGEAPSN